MNRHILTRGAVVVALALAVGGCDQGLTRVNQDPNGVSLSGVTSADLLPTILQDVVGTIAMPFGTDWDDWAQQTSQIQYPAETVGEVRPGTIQGRWDNFYSHDLKNIAAIEQKGKDAGYANVQAVAMIWSAFTWDQMTDEWGDIPYSEALQGATNITPKYDTQQQVYAGMMDTLTAAYSMLGATDANDNFSGGDLIYNNDWTEWKRFDAALRMRLAMRLSNVDPATAKSDFVAAYTDLTNAGGFTNADNAALPWAGGNYGNPWWANCLCGGGNRDDNGVSKTLVDSLLSWQDPRITFYAEPSTAPDSVVMDGIYIDSTNTGDTLRYLGRTNGKIAEDHAYGFYSRIGNYWRANGVTTPSQILDAAEVYFLEAEAALRGWISGDPGTFYTAGITAAFQMYTATGYPSAPTAAGLTKYLANPRVAWPASGTNGSGVGTQAAPSAGQLQIQYQKWISLYLVGMEAWSNWRRTRIPNLMPGPGIVAGKGSIQIIPVREPYSSDEQSLNDTNLMAAVAAQGGGLSLITNMWWDTNSNAYQK